MMIVTLDKCQPKLEAMGVFMEERGAFNKLVDEITKRRPFLPTEWSEYNDPPVDILKLFLDLQDGAEVPDMSEFGELVSVEHQEW